MFALMMKIQCLVLTMIVDDAFGDYNNLHVYWKMCMFHIHIYFIADRLNQLFNPNDVIRGGYYSEYNINTHGFGHVHIL